MFKSLKSKLFGKKIETQVVVEEIIQVEEETQVDKENHVEEENDVIALQVEDECFDKTSTDLKQESVDLELVNKEDFLDLTTTKNIQAKYDEIINKLDEMAKLVEDQTVEMNTIEKLQHSSSFLVEEDEIDSINAEKNNLSEDSIDNAKKMLIADSEEIKRNSNTYQINVGMSELSDELQNANLIISDTNIPQPITKEDVLEK